MENLSSADQDYALWLMLLKARRCVFKARDKELSQYGITPEQAGVLFIIQALNNKVTPAEISRLTCREPHTVSVLISRMEKNGLVRKVKDLDRKNLIRIVLTEKGRQAYDHSSKRETIYSILSVLSKEERQQLQLSLERVMDRALEELGQYYKPPFLRSR